MATHSSNPADQDDDADVLDLLLILFRNVRLLAGGAIASGLVGLVIALAIPSTYTATTKLLPPQHNQSAALLASQLSGLATLAGATGLNIKNPSDLYVALLKSRTIADRIVDQFNLMAIYREDYREDARKRLEDRTKVTASRDGLVAIEVEDKDPKRAAAVANHYVHELSTLTSRLAITEAQQRRAFFEKQLQQAQDNLQKAELALNQVGTGESLLKSAPQAVLANIAQLKALVTAQEIKLSTMRSYLTESSPQYQLALKELSSLRAQLTQTEQTRPAKGNESTDYVNRYRNFKYQETLLELLAKQYEMARLDEAREGSIIQVVDAATPPEKPSKPKRLLIVLVSMVLGLLFLALALFFREMTRRDPTTARKMEHIAAGVRRLLHR